ncbi:MAG: aminodeoxychorismate synthase component I [Chloroflexota bacterium]|nr:MAG: aminodeoxychorismate synthase component I [Chloroflexota bacterium]
MERYPLIEEIHTPLTAPEVFQLVHSQLNTFFLDSGMDPKRLGRYSFIGTDPFLVMNSRGNQVKLIRQGKQENKEGNPFDFLGNLLETYRLDSPPSPVPFWGGAVGYFSYDLCHFIERLPTTAIDDLKLPESYFGFYDTVIAFDNLENKTYIASTGFPEIDENKRLKRAKLRLEEMKSRLSSPSPHTTAADSENAKKTTEAVLKANFTPEGYMEAVDRVREYIAAGDVFQVNISQRFETELNITPYELYRRLRRINPAPFASYLNFDGITVVSASPERFLRVDGDWVETRPIKGTRPRGKSEAEDAMLAQELLDSIKDRAENVMIVDLERNDLGRVCQYGTVKVTELAILETFPTVFHLTSTVIGKLRPDKNRIDLLKASFPGGSITGAPKVRAMEIIDELEPTRRSVYTGAIGYLGFGYNLDLNIVIRTFIIKGNKAYFQVGGGIIYDSNAEAEFQETLDKAKALIQALRLAPRVAVETK